MAIYIQADKTLASASSGFSLFGGREQKYMDAAELYIEAANAFRMQKMSMSTQQHRCPFYIVCAR